MRARLGVRKLERNGVLARTGSFAFYVLSGRPTFGSQRAKPGDLVYSDGEARVSGGPATVLEVESLEGRSGAPLLVLRSSATTPLLHIADGKAEVRLLLDGVAAPFAVDTLCAKKGARIPRHTHASDELLYILSGRGTTTIADQETPSAAGDLITIPRDTPHALAATSDLCAVQVYAPSGPEQRFKPAAP